MCGQCVRVSFAVDNVFADRPLMDEYFNDYSIVNDAIAKAIEQVYARVAA